MQKIAKSCTKTRRPKDYSKLRKITKKNTHENANDYSKVRKITRKTHTKMQMIIQNCEKLQKEHKNAKDYLKPLRRLKLRKIANTTQNNQKLLKILKIVARNPSKTKIDKEPVGSH